jgi:heme O synthase-like polyprenyltransferase
MSESGMAGVSTSRFRDLGWLDRRFPKRYRSDLLVRTATSLWLVVLMLARDAATDVFGPWRYVFAAVFAGAGVLALAVAVRRQDDTVEVASEAARWHKHSNYALVAVLLVASSATVVVELTR